MSSQLSGAKWPHPVPFGLSTSALFLLALGGCGSGDGLSRVPVGGTVAVDGAPLRAGVVRFIPVGATKGPAAVATVKDGTFELREHEGPVVGTHRVEIEALNYLDFQLDNEQAFAARAASGKPTPRNPIPARFNRESELTVQFSPQGDRDLSFQLDTKGASVGRSVP
jgi:hypothetical protein